MKMARFNGYPITLQTNLSADEGHMRLVDEFYGVRRYRGWQAMSDKRLAGWQEKFPEVTVRRVADDRELFVSERVICIDQPRRALRAVAADSTGG